MKTSEYLLAAMIGVNIALSVGFGNWYALIAWAVAILNLSLFIGTEAYADGLAQMLRTRTRRRNRRKVK